MFELLKSSYFVAKVVELVLSALCAILIEGLVLSDSVLEIEITHMTIYGFILLNLLTVFAYIIEEPLSSRLSTIISGTATVFYVISAFFLISFFSSSESISRRILAAGLISLLNAVIFGADCFFSFRYIPE